MKKLVLVMLSMIGIGLFAQLPSLESSTWNLDSIHTYFGGSLVRRNSSTGVWIFTNQGTLKSQMDKFSQPVSVDYIIQHDTIIADRASIMYKIEKVSNTRMELRTMGSFYDADNFIRYYFTLLRKE